MHKSDRIWIVVADSSHAQFLTPSAEQRRLVAAHAAISNLEQKTYARDLKSDRPGRTTESDRSGVRHAIEPKHDYRKLEKHKFSAQIATLLERAFARREFDGLILVAPRRSLGELRSLLPAGLRTRVRKQVAKDLTKGTREDLYRQLVPTLRLTLAR